MNTSNGYPYPLGVSKQAEGVNFALASKSAQNVTLCLFKDNLTQPSAEIQLDPEKNKTGDVWHACVYNLEPDTYYAYRIADKLVLDPYAKAVTSTNSWGASSPYSPLGVIFTESAFDWEGVKNPDTPMKDLIIYEMHVRGFTKDASSQVKNPGTFLGIIEKIPHFLEMGVNAIELLPSQEFNENEYDKMSPTNKQRLYNYWGYSTVNFFSLMNRYAADPKPGSVINEFKTMVRELHRNGIEVILDVVYNHTSERGHDVSYMNIDKSIYYMLDKEGKFLDFTGCGHTFNCNHPVVRELILSSLRHLVAEYHIDGFRFDLASVLGRDESGTPLPNPPIIEAIAKDPVLAKTKLIAEPWDVGGLYQVGFFYPHLKNWSEWNGKYRDHVRCYIKGTPQKKQKFATRISGSQDLYGINKLPANGINFVTVHDGFTMMDLVSYNHKHNKDNGEDNRDGMDANDSWNCGVEGPSINKKVLALRQQQMRNFQLALMVSQGVPIVLMGDEYGHTRKGNNNTWCQDNELNWFLWDKLEQNGLNRYLSKLIKLRKEHPILHKGEFLTGEDIEWHGTEPGKPNWEADDRFIAFTLKDKEKGYQLYVAFNASSHSINVTLPKLEKQCWKLLVATTNPSPSDIFDENEAPEVKCKFRIHSYSAILLKAKL